MVGQPRCAQAGVPAVAQVHAGHSRAVEALESTHRSVQQPAIRLTRRPVAAAPAVPASAALRASSHAQ